MPIFDNFGITKQVKSAFGKTVNLPSGAYLIIEHTEALHVIDVNSGYKSVSNNQEQNALETNLEAAEEIARQLRLRDLGGIIVVDFIDMKLPENKKETGGCHGPIHAARQGQARRSADHEIRIDADHPPAHEAGNQYQYQRDLSKLPGHR